jgi:hypothetical protein
LASNRIALIVAGCLAALPMPMAAAAAGPNQVPPQPSIRPAAPATAPSAPKAESTARPGAGDDAAEAKAREDAEPQADAEGGLPVPETRPTLARPLGSAGLDLALKLIANGDYAGATLAAYALPNRVDIKIVDG